jgi:hypothetical protein
VTTSQQRSEWTELIDRLNTGHSADDVTIEVIGAEGSDNALVERLPFESITYDHKDDVVVVSVGGRAPRYPVVLRHLVSHPREILLDDIRQGAALKITDAAGDTTLISLLRRREDEAAPGT